MEKFDSQEFRKELAQEIKSVPKEERKEILEKVKESPEYWQARGETIASRQEEESRDDGLGVFVKRKTLYHGSGTEGIAVFNKAEEDTVGSGVYFTSEAKDAVGYAKSRAGGRVRGGRKDAKPVIYEAVVENMKLLDLRKDNNVKKVMEGFKKRLVELRRESSQKLSETKDSIYWYRMGNIDEVIEKIDEGKVGAGNVRDATFHEGDVFSDYVKSLGYDGLITFEGGMGGYVGNHDSYVIFDPEKAKIIQSHQVS